MSDAWKRKQSYRQERYPEQLQLQLNKIEAATPAEFEEWYETELKWWGDRQIPFVAVMAFVQLFVFIGMLTSFLVIDGIFNG